jgi:biotin transport system ATP-binding protein/energy-coupling factor transport system ATP-binding protein
MIAIQGLSYSYNGQAEPVLRNLHLDIREGEHVALIGPNGCGKTTLLRHLNALFTPDQGCVRVDGMDASDPKNLREIRRRVGLVFQNPDNQIVGMTVEEDVAFGPENLGLSAAEIRQRTDEALIAVGMEAFSRRAPHTLSGGEKRLVSIAGVLAMRPRYIAFDEPTAYLDPAGRKRVLEMIRTLHRRGMTVIHITHDMNDLLDADRLLIMDRGAIAADGPPRDVFTRMDAIQDLGLQLPQITLLLQRLRENGCALNANILTVEEACAELLSVLHRRKGSPDA